MKRNDNQDDGFIADKAEIVLLDLYKVSIWYKWIELWTFYSTSTSMYTLEKEEVFHVLGAPIPLESFEKFYLYLRNAWIQYEFILILVYLTSLFMHSRMHVCIEVKYFMALGR